jgi:hypothetical protein
MKTNISSITADISTHDAAGCVYEHASPCTIMYATCCCTPSILFLTTCIVSTLL